MYEKDIYTRCESDYSAPQMSTCCVWVLVGNRDIWVFGGMESEEDFFFSEYVV